MNQQVRRELFWLLASVGMTLLAMLIISWQSDWAVMPGHTLDFQLHDSYINISFGLIAVYVFSLAAMLLYTLRNFTENFQKPKLNLIMLVIYGYVAYVNYSLAAMFGTLSLVFYSIMVVALLLAAITVGMMVFRFQKGKK
ncbi:hypothetical protein BH09BAC1_BH09BAC1_12150 [soil metagenome]